MASRLSDAQIAKYKDAFSVFDKDGSGRISVRELASVMRSLGNPISEPEAKEMVAEVDDDGSGELSFPEFLKLMASRAGGAGRSAPTAVSSDDLARVFEVRGATWTLQLVLQPVWREGVLYGLIKFFDMCMIHLCSRTTRIRMALYHLPNSNGAS